MTQNSENPQELLTEKRGRAGIITLNRPKSLNSLNHSMAKTMTKALRAWKEDDEVQIIIIQGAGDKAFCAGGDVAAVYHSDIDKSYDDGDDFFDTEYTLNTMISEYPKPYVPIMSGYVLGGGIGLSAHGSHRIVTDSSRVGMPETGIGFFPDCGVTYLLSRAPHQLGMHLALTGVHVNAGDAIRAGLADYYVPAEALEGLVDKLIETGDVSLISAAAAEPPAGMEIDEEEMEWAYQAKSPKRIRERLREIDADWAREALEAFEKVSPSSLRTTFATMRSAPTMSLRAVIAQDRILARDVRRRPDFKEGIRAQLIDKDRNPKWKPATL